MSSCPNCSSIIIADQSCIACGHDPASTVLTDTAKTTDTPPAQTATATKAAPTADNNNAFIAIAGVLLIAAAVAFFMLT